MGQTELALILKYGVPLVIKLMNNGQDSTETATAVHNTIVGIANGGASEAFLNADQQQTEFIVTAMYGILNGAGEALFNLAEAVGSLFPQTDTE